MFFEELTPEPEQLHIVCGDFNNDHSSKNIKLTKVSLLKVSLVKLIKNLAVPVFKFQL